MILSTELGMKGWPPQPGLTVMHSTMSTTSVTSRTISTGVAGVIARPARQPASLTWFSA